jgi:hypothetical protein
MLVARLAQSFKFSHRQRAETSNAACLSTHEHPITFLLNLCLYRTNGDPLQGVTSRRFSNE